MKKEGLTKEYHPSKKSAEDWKALWDDVKYDRTKKQWFLVVNQRRLKSYGKWLDKFIKQLEKEKKKR